MAIDLCKMRLALSDEKSRKEIEGEVIERISKRMRRDGVKGKRACTDAATLLYHSTMVQTGSLGLENLTDPDGETITVQESGLNVVMAALDYVLTNHFLKQSENEG